MRRPGRVTAAVKDCLDPINGLGFAARGPHSHN